MAEHRIPSLGQVRFIHILTAGGGGHLCSNRGGGVPLVPARECEGLVGIISQAGRELKPLRLRMGWSAAGLAGGGTSRVRGLPFWVGGHI